MQTIPSIVESLEKCAESGVDLTERVFTRFYELCNEAPDLMDHSDARIRGQMVDQTFLLLMDEQLQGDGNYFRWEIANHLDAYEVKADMYETYLLALRDCVQAELGTNWSEVYSGAWLNRIESIVQEVNEVGRG